MQTEVLVALIVSSIALISAVVTALVSAKKNDLDILRGIISELRKEVEKFKCENRDLMNWAKRLVNQVKEAGLVPEMLIRSECEDPEGKDAV
jgi:hypothetical protein